MSVETGYFALRDGTGALEVGRDVVKVFGPDAEIYLQGQTSQDIAALGAGRISLGARAAASGQAGRVCAGLQSGPG